MKTTIELPNALLKEAKALAAREGATLRELVEAALRSWIRERKGKQRAYKLPDCGFRGEGLQHGFDMDDFAKIRDASYGERGGDSGS